MEGSIINVEIFPHTPTFIIEPIICNFKDEPTKVTVNDIENSDFGDFVRIQRNKPEPKGSDLFAIGDPNGTRTHVTTVKGWCLNRLTMGPSIYIVTLDVV